MDRPVSTTGQLLIITTITLVTLGSLSAIAGASFNDPVKNNHESDLSNVNGNLSPTVLAAENETTENRTTSASDSNSTYTTPAPTPPINTTSSSTNRSLVVTHNLQQNRTSYSEYRDQATFATASTNGSARYTEGFRPADYSTDPGGERVNIQNTTQYPYSAVVRLRIQAPNGQRYTCSGALVGDNHVLTAAHCVYLYDDQGNAIGWADQITVIPAENAEASNSQPFPTAEVINQRTFSGWTESQNEEDDMALLTLNRGIGNRTGWFGYATYPAGDTAYESRSHLTGYPDSPPSGVFPTMWDHVDEGAGTTCDYDYNCGLHRYWMIGTNGASGGPVWQEDSSGTGHYQILSIHAYGRESPSKPNIGPRFTSEKYSQISDWINESDRQYTPDSRPELYNSGPNLQQNPGVAEWGDPLNIQQAVTNIGLRETGCFTVGFYLSRNHGISQSDRQIGESEICSLAPGETQVVNWSGYIPIGVTGTTYVGTIVDTESNISEYGDYANDKSGTRFVTRRPRSIDLRSISLDATRLGEIDYEDPSGYRGEHEPVTFTGQAGQEIQINMNSSSDPYLLLQNPSGEIVANDDDSGHGSNASIQHELQSTGEYTIIATNYDEDNSRLYYELGLNLIAPEEPPYNVTRTITDQQPRAGATVPVRIEVELDSEGGIQITDTFASNLSAEITDGFGGLDNVGDGTVTFNNPAGTAQEYEVIYEVTIPEDAEAGTTYTFDGTVQSSQEASITGNSTLTVQDGDWYDPYVDENGVVTSTGLNTAVGEYLNDELSDSEFNTIIQSYLGGEPLTA